MELTASQRLVIGCLWFVLTQFQIVQLVQFCALTMMLPKGSQQDVTAVVQGNCLKVRLTQLRLSLKQRAGYIGNSEAPAGPAGKQAWVDHECVSTHA